MVTIYGIEVLRVHGEERPVLRYARVKETKLHYIVDGSYGFLGYRRHITKARVLSFSPRHAWETYIERCNQMRAQLRDRAEEATTLQRMALDQLGCLSEGEA